MKKIQIANGAPTCGKCSGASFTPQRKTSTKVLFGFASLVGKPKHLMCVACGEVYEQADPARTAVTREAIAARRKKPGRLMQSINAKVTYDPGTGLPIEQTKH